MGSMSPRGIAMLGAGLVAGVLALVPGTAPVAHATECAPADHDGGDWRSYGHDLANTRHQDQETTIGTVEAATLAPVWTLRVSDAPEGATGDITGTPVIADGCLYVGTNEGWVIAANADTGGHVWATKVPKGGSINSSLNVIDGVVYAGVSHTSSLPDCQTDCTGPYVAAFDQLTGTVLWSSPRLDSQPGADLYASPVIHDGALLIGVSGGSAELGDETDRYAFQGSMSFIDITTGEIIKKTWTIHPPVSEGGMDDGFAGGAIWSTPAIEPELQVAYVGSGNPFQPQQEHPNTNAVLAFDVNRASPTFGEIIGSYKGEVDEYFPELSEAGCIYDIDGNPPPWYPQGLGACNDIDLDFGASPNLFTDPETGRLVVGTGQKSGVYHVFDAATMAPAWSQIVGVPSSVGGIVGSTAFDGEHVYGPVTVPGYVWSLDRSGTPRWFSPTADGVHWGNPVASANGVIYTMDFKGFLDAYDAATGAPLLHRSLYLGSDITDEPLVSWGGVSVARNTVYTTVGISGLPEGFVVAFRPGGVASTPEAPTLPDAPTPAPGSSGASEGMPIVAGPGAVATTYATPVVVAQQGAQLTFANGDIARHDVISDDGLFSSILIGAGETTTVNGTESLAPGEYGFYCSLHRNMTGTLVVQ